MNKKLAMFALVTIITCAIFFEEIKVSVDSMYRKKKQKIVVFDLDETLGHFTELAMFWDSIKEIEPSLDTPQHFYQVMDLYPEFVRPHIRLILKLIYDNKKAKRCDRLIIYTNNQGPKRWTQLIAGYFQHKLQTSVPLFDNIIATYKYNNKIVEKRRTTHNKTVGDIVRCTNIPKNSDVCFVDDQFHPYMKDERVLYLNIKPFTCSMPFNTMALRYYNKYGCRQQTIKSITKPDFIKLINQQMSRYNYKVFEKSNIEKKVDVVIGKHIYNNIKKFLNPNTRKMRRRKNKTKKTRVKPLF